MSTDDTLYAVPCTPVGRLQDYLTRSGLPHLLRDIRSDEEGRALVGRIAVLAQELSLVVCPSGPVLELRSNEELAA